MRKPPTRLAILLMLVLGLAVLAAGCGGDDDEDEAAPTATDTGAAMADCTGSVGVMAPITGDAASIGVEQLNFAKYAVQRYNEENDTSFEAVEGDTQLDPAQASTVAQRFVSNDEILAVVGRHGPDERQVPDVRTGRAE